MNFTREGKEVVYIHYGTTSFDPERFEKVKNCRFSIKPSGRGGFWASPINSERNWFNWAKINDFRIYDIDNCFKFKLKNPNKILYINSEEAYNYLTSNYGIKVNSYCPFFIDFEKMIKDGWDALEASLTDFPELYDLLYTWDCDSILIFNSDAICEI